jgi:hypothetical protein
VPSLFTFEVSGLASAAKQGHVANPVVCAATDLRELIRDNLTSKVKIMMAVIPFCCHKQQPQEIEPQ